MKSGSKELTTRHVAGELTFFQNGMSEQDEY